jgi:DNA-binding winged helix-turn-helix (wHTH) protein
VDLEAGELRRNGLKVRLQEQPFRVLALLIANPGQLLRREELQEQLWPGDTLVDAELGLNTAVKKIRAALADSADNPRFVETIPTRGYRFIASVRHFEHNGVGLTQAAPGRLPPPSDKIEEPVCEVEVVEIGKHNARAAEDLPHSETLEMSQKYLERKRIKQEEPESERDAATRLKQDRHFGKAAPLFSASHGKGFLYWIPALLLAVAGVVIFARQYLSLEHPYRNRAVSVYRGIDKPGQPGFGIGGYDLKSPADRAFAFDYEHSGKLDHLVFYRPGTGTISIVKNSGGTFSRAYQQNGIGGYDLKSHADRAFAFDYDHSGKLDHLVLYRSGTEIMSILRNDGDGIFTPVYAHSPSNPAAGIGDQDSKLSADQAFAFDYDHSGKLDHLALYRFDTRTISILKNTEGAFAPVYSYSALDGATGVLDGKLADQAFAFDYDRSGKLDHLVLYWPGAGTIVILKNSGGTFAPVYEGSGIGGYDLKSSNDRALAFDYDHSGKLDHLVFYRPGAGIIRILKHSGGNFSTVYDDKGIGGYGLMSPHDQAFAFDYDHSGKLDYLTLYRPGTGVILISHFPQKQ